MGGVTLPAQDISEATPLVPEVVHGNPKKDIIVRFKFVAVQARQGFGHRRSMVMKGIVPCSMVRSRTSNFSHTIQRARIPVVDGTFYYIVLWVDLQIAPVKISITNLAGGGRGDNREILSDD